MYKGKYFDELSEIAYKNHVSLRDALGRSRIRTHVKVRYEIAKHLRYVRELSYSQIGRIMDRHHSTVMYYCGETSKNVKWVN